MNEIIMEISALGIATFCFFDSLRNRTELYRPFPKGWKEKLKNQHFTYLALVLMLMISSTSSVSEVVMEQFITQKTALALDIVNEIYFIFHTALPALFALYIIDITGSSAGKDKRFFTILLAPIVFIEVLIFANPFTHLIYYIDSTPSYNRGSLMWLVYLIALGYVVTGIVFLVKNVQKVSKLNRTATIILVSIAVLGILIQAILLIPVELFFEAIAFFGFMLLLEDEKYRENTGRTARMDNRFIAVIALIFCAVILMNINIIYNAGTDQMGRIGEIQINSLKGELQQAISEAESRTLHYSMGVEQLINDSAGLDEIEAYITLQENNYKDVTEGSCFSVYAASPEWTIIPGFDYPDDYHAVERVWYTGATQHPGQIYISEPYVDADTGNVCLTFSYLLSDGKTVTAMDYTLEHVQSIVGQMGNSAEQFAMIVTDGGTIVGCSETGAQGKELSVEMPEYAEVFDRVTASNEHKSFRTKINDTEKIIFASETVNGWNLILAADYSSFYSEIYNQMVMLGAIDLLMVAVIIVFYMVSISNQQKAENLLSSTEGFIASLTGDLRAPLRDILRVSGTYRGSEEKHSDALREVSEAGKRLWEKMDNLFSYSGILRAEEAQEKEKEEKKKRVTSASSRKMRNSIIGILIAALVIGLALCLGVTTRWGQERISNEADAYNNEVIMWVQQKESILRMFSDVIAADPDVLSDYDRGVKWLNDIAGNYSEMTFAYMANPNNKEHPVIMNNGWVPGPDFVLEDREWYIDCLNSGSGFSISAPYYDAQTGLYCITFSRSVYSPDGEFLGVFGIDCLLDKLIDVLDDSYTPDSYAFLVDRDGTIINHPYKGLELSPDKKTNIEDTEYADVYHAGSRFWMRDFDDRLVACHAKKSTMSGFTVIVVQNWWSIYGDVFIMTLIFLTMIVISIVAVAKMIRRFIIWQEHTNEQLINAVDSAVAAEKAKSGFLAQMSHEIRTPINAVLGMNEMILRESDDEAIREYAGNIQSAGRNLLTLINSILDFSKIEEGKMEIIPVRYDTSAMIGSVVNSVSARAAEKGLEFNVHVDDKLPSMLYGDDMRVAQVATNLLTNAVKYTKEGSVDLFIGGNRKDDETLSLTVRVKDTGIGIKPEDIEKLSESFTRLEETRNRNIEGTGLGMTIVNRLLDMMDSKLEIKSVYGEGSDFSFAVDQTIIDGTPIGDYEKRARETAKSETGDTCLYAPDAKVLVVDDSNMNLIVIQSLLKQNGIKPELATSGQEALRRMELDHYDVVLLDHMMPEMDGMETLRKAGQDDLIPEGCSVIALTANAVVGAREEYLEAGFDDYLSKPVDVKELEDVLSRHLPKEKVSRISLKKKN